MNTHTRSVSRAPRARVRPLYVTLAVGALAPLVGCGQPAEIEPDRPSIAVEESRCSTVELVGLRRADRLVVADDGRIGLVGSRVDEDGYEAGRAFELDPYTGEARVFDSSHPRTVAAWIDGVLYTDGRGALEPADVDSAGPQRFAVPDGLPVDVSGDSPDLYVSGDEALMACKAHDALRPEMILRLADRDGQSELVAHHGILGARLGDDWIDATPEIRSFVPTPDGRVYAVGRARAASVLHADLRPADRPRTYVGFVSIARATRPEAEDGAFDALDHAVATWQQPDFWPMRVVLDHQQRPTVLYITGHEGKRIEQGRPYMARLSPEGELIDPRPLPLPDLGTHGAEHGGVQAALPLEDGGWLIGGSACRPGRSMCKGFVSRLDRKGEPLWTGFVVRESASTVVDLALVDGRVFALGVSSPYCCEYDSYRNGGWIVELEGDGTCPTHPVFAADGQWLR